MLYFRKSLEDRYFTYLCMCGCVEGEGGTVLMFVIEMVDL